MVSLKSNLYITIIQATRVSQSSYLSGKHNLNYDIIVIVLIFHNIR